MILGKLWLREHNPHTDWSHDLLTFDKECCRQNCLPTGTTQLCCHSHQPTPLPVPKNDSPYSLPRRVSAHAFHLRASSKDRCEVFSLSFYEIDQHLKARGIDVSPSYKAADTTEESSEENIRRAQAAAS
ncbi:hypothetical protein BJ878DRAFT_224289 [Calycina marina]|uniref:Uncharacterized protein n=1 Tax=Calycina marina TaxID=1763456 RepID=A0A9P8CC18_9HELO|nr:hypothetical protein BJ878DRAFT_224289 [Calycina marina]